MNLTTVAISCIDEANSLSMQPLNYFNMLMKTKIHIKDKEEEAKFIRETKTEIIRIQKEKGLTINMVSRWWYPDTNTIQYLALRADKK